MDVAANNGTGALLKELPRGGYLAPETYLVQARVNGRTVIGITTNEGNYTNPGDPDLGAKVALWVDDGLGGVKKVDGEVEKVLGEVSGDALDRYLSQVETINEVPGHNQLKLNDLLAEMGRRCKDDHHVSGPEAADGFSAFLSQTRRDVAINHVVAMAPSSSDENDTMKEALKETPKEKAVDN